MRIQFKTTYEHDIRLFKDRWTLGIYTILIGGDHFAMFRFYVPILPLIAFAMVLMAEHWVASNARASATALAILCTLSVAAVSAVNYWTYAGHGGTTARDEVELARRWSDVGRWL